MAKLQYKSVGQMAEDVFRALEDTWRKIRSGQSVGLKLDLFATILKLVGEWKPQRKSGWQEKQYRKNLLEFLKGKRDPNNSPVRIDEGQRSGDIFVKGYKQTVGIELKLDLKDPKEANRLKGQLDDLKKDCSGVIVLLLGKTVENRYEDVREKINELRTIHPIIPAKVVRRPF